MKSLLLTLGLLAGCLNAAQVTYQFAGATSSAMNVNNGSSAGGVPAGTSFSGMLTFDDAQTAAPAAFWGGTHSTYSFVSMSLIMGATTVTWGPGKIDVYDNVTSTGGGYPVGDSFYANVSTPVPPSGPINGAQFNWIFLGLVDPTGTVFNGSGLPANLHFASFQNPFIEFNFGTAGTPWGAGNTSTLQFLSTLSKNAASPAPPPTITTTSLPNGVIGVPYSVPVTASGPNGDAVTVSVSGLPTGLSFNGASIVGSPSIPGTASVVIGATDNVTKLSTSATLPLTINDAVINFAPTLANGVVNSPYSSSFAPATGGTGVFTYTAAGLPPGLGLLGNTISGTPTGVGSSTVLLTATDTAGSSITASATLTISAAVATTCSGKNAVESAYVARTPGYIVVNGGLNLLDHLWTTNLNSSNTTFLGGLTNWYQTGLILDYAGTVDPAGCILTTLTVAPAVTIDTASLPNAVAGSAYSAPITISWGVAPYNVTVAGLPSGMTYSGGSLSGAPMAAGAFSITVTAVDSLGATASKNLTLLVADQTISFAPALPAGTVGSRYSATLAATGFGPFSYGAAGLPAGLSMSGSTIAGIPTKSGSFAVTLTATDAAGNVVTIAANLTISAASSNRAIPDEGQGTITSIGPGYSYVMIGSKELTWNAATAITVNTPGGELHAVDGFVQAGMVVQWKGWRDQSTNNVLTTRLEIN